MNFDAELKAAADPTLATITDLQWRVVHAIYEWMLVGATFPECRQRIADIVTDPTSVAFKRPAIKADLQDLNTKLQDATIRSALSNLQATYLQKRADFRAVQDARRDAAQVKGTS